MRRSARLSGARIPGLAIVCSWVALATCSALSHAQSPATLSGPAFLDQVRQLQSLAAACGTEAKACDPSHVPDRQRVQAASASFTLGWEWLRDALTTAKTAKAQDRFTLMRDAQQHLATLAGEAGASSPVPRATFQRARAAAQAALARDEFRAAAAEGPSWLDRQGARLQGAILRLFTGVGRLGQRAPWLAPLIQWSCFGLAAAGLLWFVRRSLARQALRISLADAAALVPGGGRDSADWAHLAEQHAAAQDWREAVHCLYWAAIALMEGRRAWKPNATRTPREYLRLLRAGSASQDALRALTQTFERVWYGHGEADEPQYMAALKSLQVLENTRPERTTSTVEPGQPNVPLAAAGGA